MTGYRRYGCKGGIMINNFVQMSPRELGGSEHESDLHCWYFG